MYKFGKSFLIIILAFMISSMSFNLNIENVKAATPAEIEASITDGLAWLAEQQQGDGRWQYGVSPISGVDFSVTSLVCV
ncbi:unnamed protein product [marine sediment metagenome]|uniref:Squalene cyclase C-terminal domain-containing protein n=1 Tax=marine sediment metagenome TaxID=412755 RepID=X0YWY0_9ZZZZ